VYHAAYTALFVDMLTVRLNPAPAMVNKYLHKYSSQGTQNRAALEGKQHIMKAPSRH